MTVKWHALVEQLNKAQFCRKHLQPIADSLEQMNAEMGNRGIARLIAEERYQALRRWLNICAMKRVKLDPETLCKALVYCKRPDEFVFCFREQDETLVPHLLELIDRPDFFEVSLLAALLTASELTAIYDLERWPVEKRIWSYILSERSNLKHVDAMPFLGALRVLDYTREEIAHMQAAWGCRSDIYEHLPEHPPPVAMGDGYTPVRRVMPRISRNAPCPCGSGKKYKKCCEQQDAARNADASAHEGVTATQLRENPTLFDDPEVIRNLMPYELVRIAPACLCDHQLEPALIKALDAGYVEYACDVFEQVFERNLPCGASPLRMAVWQACLKSRDEQLMRKHLDLVMPDERWEGDGFLQFEMKLARYHEFFSCLDDECRMVLQLEEDDETEAGKDGALAVLTFALAMHYPALAVLVARAYYLSGCYKGTACDMAVHNAVRRARLELDLYPWDPAIELYLETFDDELPQRMESDPKGQLAELSRELAQSRKALDEKNRSLCELEAQLDRVRTQARARQEDGERQRDAGSESPATDTPPEMADSEALRRKIRNLKAEVANQQQRRAELRAQLDSERRHKADAPPSPEKEAGADPGDEVPPETGPVHVPLPDYSSDFRKDCERVPSHIVGRALQAIAGFAAQDKVTRQQTRQLSVLKGHYRIRIGIHYRLILRRGPGRTLTAVGLVPREELDQWIKRHSS